MREDDGRKLDHKTLQDIRVRSVRQISEGRVSADEVADSLGFARSTVFSWMKAFREGGAAALVARPVPGRPSKLSEEQMRGVVAVLVGKNPEQLGFEFALWTRWMVGDLITRLYGVTLSEASVGRMLRRMGMSPQRPVVRAYQQDADAVALWKGTLYPAIKAEAVLVGASIYFGDEAGVRADYHSHTTWAPVGQTPVVRSTGARFSLNMLSAVNAQGRLSFMLHQGRGTSEIFIEFCRRLLADDGGIVFLVLDNHSIHKSQAVKQFLASTAGKLRLFYLPTYSPELNPDEWVWKNVKHDRIGRSTITSIDDLYGKAFAALQRLQGLPDLVRGFFRDPDLHYITR